MRHSLLVCFVLLLASACWCGTVLAAQENIVPGCGTHSILSDTVASALTPLAQEANQDTDAKSATNTVSRSESTADTFEPIRIGVFFDSLYDDSRYCANATANVTYYEYRNVPCTESQILTEERRSTLINTIMPRAVELVSERLLVRRYNTAIKVPRYRPSLHCGYVTIPEEHHTNGVSGYDVIFYVTAKPNWPNVAAWALGCTNNDDGDGRPIVALVNFGPDQIQTKDDWPIYTAAHEMIHGLGFNNAMFSKLNKLKTTSVRGKANSLVLNTGPMLKATMADHFGCANQAFIEMHDDGSHWKERTMNEDIMTAFTSAYFGAITLAALEDTGMYKAVYDKADVSPWGRGAGCAFLDQPCLTNSVALPNTKFCANKVGSNYHCNRDRTALASCANDAAPSDASWASGYGQWSTAWELEYCPTYSQVPPAFRCSVSSVYNFDSVNGSSSRCLDATSATKYEATTEGVCAAVRCNTDSYDVQLKNGAWTTCLVGTTLKMQSAAGVTRTITCPPMYEVCRVERGVLDSLKSQSGSRVSSVSVSLIVALCAALVSIWAAV